MSLFYLMKCDKYAKKKIIKGCKQCIILPRGVKTWWWQVVTILQSTMQTKSSDKLLKMSKLQATSDTKSGMKEGNDNLLPFSIFFLLHLSITSSTDGWW